MSALGRQPRCALIDRQTGQVLLPRLELALTWWQRLRGWQMADWPSPGSGLLLYPCWAIHTLGMRFPIDAAFLASDGTILALLVHRRPWRLVPPVRSAIAVLEVPSGGCLLRPGQQLGVAVSDGLMLKDLPFSLVWEGAWVVDGTESPGWST